MSPRTPRLCLAFAAGLLALSQASACIEVEPRQNVEFREGSAELSATQVANLIRMLDEHDAGSLKHRVSVRGYADRAPVTDAKAWKPEDLALADARARALSEAVRGLGGLNCVERVALGHAPGDAGADRVDEDGQHWLARAVVVLAAPDSHDTAPEGVRIETDCGPAPPKQLPAPPPKT